MSEFTCLEFNVADSVASITLNRPEAGNSLNPDLARELKEVARRCDRDPSIRAILLSANGKMFCVGGDLKGMKDAGDDADQFVKGMADDLHSAISTLSRMKASLVVAVKGTAAGAGFSIALAGDIVIAGPNAKFTMAYTASGLSPDGGSTYFLPRLVGLRRAQELALTNRVLNAQEAREWGIVTQVSDEDDPFEAARALCRILADGSLNALGEAKRLLLASFDNSLETQMELEGRAIASNALIDGREGIAAFFEKRKPNYK